MKIADMTEIGKQHCMALHAARVRTTSRLLNVAGNRAVRRALAAETGIPEALLLQWAQRAELLELHGVGRRATQLLERAGIVTVAELRRQDPDALQRKLAALNAGRSLSERTPSVFMVRRWVAGAKSAPRRVVE